MLDQQTIIHSSSNTSIFDDNVLGNATHKVGTYGYCLLRGFDMSLENFSSVIQQLCTQVTYDPARQTSSDSVQKVDAGTDAIGLHIENGNTPKIPNMLAFYCRKAARTGSQTTLCDGIDLLNALPEELRQSFSSEMTVTRTLPEALWKAYLAQEHPALEAAHQVTEQHLNEMIAAIPGQSATMHKDGSIDYSVTISPLRISPLSKQKAFANAIMGPSFNYQPPVYKLHDGTRLSKMQLVTVCAMAEEYTHEVTWQNSDVLLVDNWRTMHGRRAIQDAANRELFVGMGTV